MIATVIILLIFAFIGFVFFRNTLKERNWLMFVWVGAIALALGVCIYLTIR